MVCSLDPAAMWHQGFKDALNPGVADPWLAESGAYAEGYAAGEKIPRG